MTQNQLAPMEEFQEKVKKKLVADIGDLIPDEALAELVKKAMDDAFFQERKITTIGQFGREDTIIKPPVFEGQVKALLREEVRGQIEKWMSDNNEEIQTRMELLLKEQMMQSFSGALSEMFSGTFSAFRFDLVSKLQESGVNIQQNY